MTHKIIRKEIHIYKVLAIAIGIIIAAILGEIFLRLYDLRYRISNTMMLSRNPRIIYEHRPLVTFKNKYGIKIKYNSLGFIGEEIGPKNDHIIRIMGVGDSITAAEYLMEDKRYPNRIAQILTKRLMTPVEVINTGVEGYNSAQELELIKTKLPALKPDIIIVGICLNDYSGRKHRIKSWLNFIIADQETLGKARYLNSLYQRSKLFRFIYDSLHRVKVLLRGRQSPLAVNFEPRDYSEWKSIFEEMILFSQRANTKILFVIFPLEQQIQRGDKYSNMQLYNFFKKKNAYFLDLMEYFKRQTQHALFDIDFLHFNELGHEIAAEEIANYIIANRIIKEIHN